MLNYILLLITGFVAAIYDYKTNKIPNWCTYPLIITGIIYQFYLQTNVWIILLIIIAFIATLFIPGIGYGDLKFLLGCALISTPIFAVKMFLTANCIVGISYLLLCLPDVITDIQTKHLSVFRRKITLPMGFSFAISCAIGTFIGFMF